MKKYELESGMRVKTRNGNIYILIGNTFVRDNGFVLLAYYDEDLICSEGRDFDIMEIYEQPYPHILKKSLEIECSRLLQKRRETKELTVEQISEKLGYDVKIIK